MGRTLMCPADQWTVLFDHAFVQLPRAWIVSFIAVDGGAVAGEIEEKRSSWIFPNPPATRPLVAIMTFERGWWTTFYAVRVKPTHDVIAQIG